MMKSYMEYTKYTEYTQKKKKENNINQWQNYDNVETTLAISVLYVHIFLNCIARRSYIVNSSMYFCALIT